MPYVLEMDRIIDGIRKAAQTDDTYEATRLYERVVEIARQKINEDIRIKNRIVNLQERTNDTTARQAIARFVENYETVIAMEIGALENLLAIENSIPKILN